MRKSAKYILLFALGTPLLAQERPEDEIEYRVLEFGENYTVFEDGLTPRLRVRANFYKGKDDDAWHSSPGQISIEYGLPKWRTAYESNFKSFPDGHRWRLGSNYWTNFSSSFPIQAGDARLPAGFYFLVLEKGDGQSWKLVFLKPSQVHELQIDPWHVNRQTSGPAVLSLALVEAEKNSATESLEIRLKLRDENPKQFLIDIRFGPVHLQSSWVTADLQPMDTNN